MEIPNQQENQYGYMYYQIEQIVKSYTDSIKKELEPKERFNELKNKYSKFYDACKLWHKESPRAHRGHGLDHDVTVAQLCLKISSDEKTGELAWISSFLHSVDRTLERGNRELVASKINYLIDLLPESISAEDRKTIFDSAINHGDLNKEDQSVIQQTLMDADRLANLMILVMIRAGQLQPDIPAIEFQYIDKPNPESTYKDPRSIIDDMRGCLSLLGEGHVGYIEQLRLPKAIELAKDYHQKLKGVVEMIERQHKDLGLDNIKL